MIDIQEGYHLRTPMGGKTTGPQVSAAEHKSG
jgi:hypothetical protein